MRQRSSRHWPKIPPPAYRRWQFTRQPRRRTLSPRSAKPICGNKIVAGCGRVRGPRSLWSASSPAAKVRQCQPAECDQQDHPCGDDLHGLRGCPADTPIQPERHAENEDDRRFWWLATPLGCPLFERDVSKKPVVYSDRDRRGDCTCRLVCRRAAQGLPG